MKKILSLLLICSLICLFSPALGEQEAARTYAFRFTMQLQESALSPGLRERARGYADLLDALRFEGTLSHSLSSSAFDLHLSVIPLDPDAAPLSFRVHGDPKFMFVSSPLLGEEQFVLSNESLLEFCAKSFEHLGLPLPYVALLLPYTWEISLAGPAQDWETMSRTRDDQGVISPGAVTALAESWSERLLSDRNLMVFSTSLGLDTGFDADFHQFLSDLPAFLKERVTDGGEIRVDATSDGETWSSACGDFASLSFVPDHERISVSLPVMESGYQPSLLYQKTSRQSRISGQFMLQVPQTLPEKPDLFDLKVSAAALPDSWPAECDSLVNFNLTGGLLANVGFTAFLKGAADGSLTLEIRKPSLDPEPGDLMLSLSGSLVPLEETALVSTYDPAEFAASTDILRVNDSSLSVFVGKVLPSFAQGILRFLFGIPTSSCQVILDDLTEYGVLNMLLGD